MMNEQKLSTLQCLVLAQIYCMAKGDYNKLLYYTGVAVNLSHRLGMHQSQKRFDFGALTRETRKKVFWTLYTLDAFAAAALGLPKLLKDADIETEEPSDVDDENVNERGFQATLPGESTKLSSALALFRAARILSKVLDELYPATSSCELSLQRVAALSDELDAWRSSLAPHLRLDFVLGKPSTNIVSSRCPLLVGAIQASRCSILLIAPRLSHTFTYAPSFIVRWSIPSPSNPNITSLPLPTPVNAFSKSFNCSTRGI